MVAPDETAPPPIDDRLARARAQLADEQLEDARTLTLQVLAQRPDDVDGLILLGQIELVMNRDDDALRRFHAAMQRAPRDAAVLKELALAQSEVGDLEAGEATVRRALALSPRYLAAHYVLSMIKRYTPGDPDLAALETIAESVDALQDRERVQLGFALGKALDDVGEHERAFAFLALANRAKRAGMTYDVEVDLDFLRRVARVFDADRLRAGAGRGHDTRLPVLIVGMPRSGTTLVEQIVASHPQVRAGGERSSLAHIASSVKLLGDSGSPFPEGVNGLDPAYLAPLGGGYAGRLARYAPDRARVTDKNLFNFAYLGMARLIVPNAHVIHVVRDPLDACVSMFGLDFAHVRFAFDLAELGRMYRGYQALMAHWRAVLPSDWVLEVRYEDLVKDLEGVARALIAHCDLEWDPRCLRFQDATHNVRTASFAQVRRPLHGGSIGRWRRFEPWLGPLTEALDGA